MENEFFENIMEGALEAVQIAEGRALPARVHAAPMVDVKAMRRRLQMTRRAFCLAFGFAERTVAAWESGERVPEGPTRQFLRVIDKNPQAVLEALTA